ncbi:hypothetical protein LOD99_14494 [Oopsacas minuta]|uniref:Uncharacterized protein n=1 Tax=Oopsacas minuta TaxID=111878 RepID=A0AAV7KDS4_9METZ|nr:hypothetical protein LOD99_14494 [Oopsacas minuta]
MDHEKRPQVHHFNNNKLPPLQNAIHEQNSDVIDYITKNSEILFTDINKLLSILKSAIHNPKVLGYLLNALREIESKGDFNQEYAPLISDCLSSCLSLSIESDNTTALNTLMQYGCKLNYPYGDIGDSLLQLTIRKSGKVEFIKLILKSLSENKDIHLTHIKDENSNIVPLIDCKNTEEHTGLHNCIQKQPL